MRKFIYCALLGLTLLTGCAIVQAVRLKDCTYEYKTVSDIRFLKLKAQDVATISGAATIGKALLGKSETAPLDMVVHIGVTNPNKGTAALERLYYKVYLDTVQVAEGQTTQSLIVSPGQTVDLPLQLSIDLKDVLKSEKRGVVGKAIKNVIGLGDEASKIRVDIKPIFKVGNGVMTAPMYIPVTFYYPESKAPAEQKKK